MILYITWQVGWRRMCSIEVAELADLFKVSWRQMCSVEVTTLYKGADRWISTFISLWEHSENDGQLSRLRLRSADTNTLHVPSSRHSTLGDRSFFVAAPWAWNELPPTLRSVTSLTTFRRKLKTLLFRRSFGLNWLVNAWLPSLHTMYVRRRTRTLYSAPVTIYCEVSL